MLTTARIKRAASSSDGSRIPFQRPPCRGPRAGVVVSTGSSSAQRAWQKDEQLKCVNRSTILRLLRRRCGPSGCIFLAAALAASVPRRCPPLRSRWQFRLAPRQPPTPARCSRKSGITRSLQQEVDAKIKIQLYDARKQALERDGGRLSAPSRPLRRRSSKSPTTSSAKSTTRQRPTSTTRWPRSFTTRTRAEFPALKSSRLLR